MRDEQFGVAEPVRLAVFQTFEQLGDEVMPCIEGCIPNGEEEGMIAVGVAGLEVEMSDGGPGGATWRVRLEHLSVPLRVCGCR